MKKHLESIKNIFHEISDQFVIAENHLEEILMNIIEKKYIPVGNDVIKDIFGEFKFTESEGGRIKIDVQFERDNFRLYHFQGKKWYLHKLVAPQFMGALAETYAHDLQDEMDFSNGGGIFSPRHKYHNPKSALSKHCWAGIAWDNNPEKFPMGSTVRQHPKLIEIWCKHGYYYGGDFSRPDPMHFEWCRFPYL